MRPWPFLVLALSACSASADRTAGSDVPRDSGAPSIPDTAPLAPSEGGIALDAATDDDFDDDGYPVSDDCDDGNREINPGAIEVAGDGVDNNCDGAIDEVDTACDESLALDSADAYDFARALGLCKRATASAKGKARTWGVLSAKLTTTDGKGAPLPRQFGIQRAFGEIIKPRDGAHMIALSSGVARTPGQPGYVDLPKGTDSTSNANAPPPGWPRNVKGCPASTKPYAFDSVVLELVVRAPTNARAFSFDFDFFSSEYVEYVCQPFNDSFVALVGDKNVAFDAAGDPINVNSGFFQACLPESWLGRTFSCPLGVDELRGTGFDAVASTLTAPSRNGATSWLRTTHAIVPGEELTVRFAIWNTGDHWLPSTVLVDRFVWSAAATTGTSTDRPK